MFNNPFIEEDAASRNKRQQLDHLLRVTAPHERLILAGIGLALLALGVWVIFGSVDRSLTLDGLLIEPGSRHAVVAAGPGHLMEFLIAPGDRVEPGDPIARQSVPELERETAALRERVSLLESEMGRVGGDGTLDELLQAARSALLEIEARRSVRVRIVSQIAGEVVALRSAPGDYLPVGAAVAEIREAPTGPLQAVLRVEARVARRIEPGMAASVEIVMPDGATRQRFSELSHVNAAFPGLFMVLGNAAVLAFGSSRVMAGDLTLGALVGFYILAAMFLEPVGRFVEFADERQALTRLPTRSRGKYCQKLWPLGAEPGSVGVETSA